MRNFADTIWWWCSEHRCFAITPMSPVPIYPRAPICCTSPRIPGAQAPHPLATASSETLDSRWSNYSTSSTPGPLRQSAIPDAVPDAVSPAADMPISPPDVYAALASVMPVDAVLVNEATSAMSERRTWLPVTRSASYYTTPSGGLGWAMPAAVGIALADRSQDVHRPVMVTIGDGSFQYSIQALWTAAQHGLPIVFVVLANGEYSVLKSFAHLENTPGVPDSTFLASTSSLRQRDSAAEPCRWQPLTRSPSRSPS